MSEHIAQQKVAKRIRPIEEFSGNLPASKFFVMANIHYEKYRNFTLFPGMEILRKTQFSNSFG